HDDRFLGEPAVAGVGRGLRLRLHHLRAAGPDEEQQRREADNQSAILPMEHSRHGAAPPGGAATRETNVRKQRAKPTGAASRAVPRRACRGTTIKTSAAARKPWVGASPCRYPRSS